MLIFVLLVSSFFVYWFQMFIISILAGFFNVRLTRAIDFKARLKLSVIISFVPIILLELMSIVIPGFIVTQFMVSAITLFLFYQAFKNHTKFIHTIMNNLDQLDIEDMDIKNDKQDDDENEKQDDKDDNQTDKK